MNLPSKSHEVACCVVSSKHFACFWSASKAVDFKGLPRGSKIFHSRLVLRQRFLSLSSTVCTFCRFRSLTFLGDDRREKAPEGTPLGWSCSSVSCHYLCTFFCLGSLTSLGGDKWKGGGAEEGKHGWRGVEKKAPQGYSLGLVLRQGFLSLSMYLLLR